MSAKMATGAIIILIIIMGAYWYTAQQDPVGPSSNSALDEAASTDPSIYAYECDEHVMLNMSMSPDAKTIVIGAAAGGAYPPAATLSAVAATSGARYEGGGFVFIGKGESISLTEGGQTLNCSPVPDPDEAPFNFGD